MTADAAVGRLRDLESELRERVHAVNRPAAATVHMHRPGRRRRRCDADTNEDEDEKQSSHVAPALPESRNASRSLLTSHLAREDTVTLDLRGRRSQEQARAAVRPAPALLDSASNV